MPQKTRAQSEALIDHLEREESARLAELEKANRARAIFEDDLFVEAVERVKDQCWDAFVSSDLEDDEARRLARLRLEAINMIIGEFRMHAETGRLAEQQLQTIRKDLDSLK